MSCLEIENFRGIRSARIDFGETTVIIGENDSGKSTLLEAICLVVSPGQPGSAPVFRPSDFHIAGGDRPAGALRIRLTFRERTADEWSFLRNNDLGITLPDKASVKQELSLEVTSSPSASNTFSPSHWGLRIEGRLLEEFNDDPALLAWIRRLNPVFRLKGGILDISPGEIRPGANVHDEQQIPEPDQKLIERIRNHYQNLVSGSAMESESELQAGYHAALQFLGNLSNVFLQKGQALGQIIYEILGRKAPEPETEVRGIVLRHGSTAEQIGMLLFTTAFLQSGGLMADPSAEPILVIEDPETHLHPMTLESVKLLIERLKWQKVITTESGSLLSGFPLEDIRRISRDQGVIRQYYVRQGDLGSEELRRLSYHVRMRMSTATFARCWLLVEGESEIWLLPHIARLCGYNLALEGIVCVEFAQCGIAPLVKAARALGIRWFLLADGDAAGKAYLETGRHFANKFNENPDDHILRLREKDIEHHLYFNGYAGVYQEYSGIQAYYSQNMQAGKVIGRAIHRNSKPFMAVAVIEAMARQGSPGVPSQLKIMIEKCIRLARGEFR